MIGRPQYVAIFLNVGRFQLFLPVDHREPVAGPTSRQTPRRWRRCTQLHHVSIDTIQRISSNSACEAPAEEKLFCSCSSLSASVALVMQPRVPVTAIETATAADLCYSCVRCVSLQSRARFLQF